MSQQHLNNRMLLNVHKDLTDGLDLPTIARQFVDADERRRRFFATAQSTVTPNRATGVNTVLSPSDDTIFLSFVLSVLTCKIFDL